MCRPPLEYHRHRSFGPDRGACPKCPFPWVVSCPYHLRCPHSLRLQTRSPVHSDPFLPRRLSPGSRFVSRSLSSLQDPVVPVQCTLPPHRQPPTSSESRLCAAVP